MYFTDFSAAGYCLTGVQDIVTALRHIEAPLTLVLLCMYIEIVLLLLTSCTAARIWPIKIKSNPATSEVLQIGLNQLPSHFALIQERRTETIKRVRG